MTKLLQIRALEKGKGIQYLLDTAYKIFNNPIVVFDTNYDLKAYTDVATDDAVWNELISTGTFSMETQRFFAKEFFTEDVANASKLVVLKSNSLKYDRLVGNVFNREHIKVANIVMVGVNAFFEPDDTAAFEELTDKITEEIHDDEYFTAFGRAYRESIIVKLLDGVIRDPLIFTDHVQIFYEGFEDYLYVAVVEIPQDDPGNNAAHQDRCIYIKNLLENKYESFKFAIYSGYIVMVMSSKYKDFGIDNFFGKDTHCFVQNNLFVGMSDSFENPYELRQYYDKAVDALNNGSGKSPGKRFFAAIEPFA